MTEHMNIFLKGKLKKKCEIFKFDIIFYRLESL